MAPNGRRKGDDLASTHAIATISSWSHEQWSAFASVVLAVGAVATGLWGIYSYRKAKRTEAARWIQGLFRDFYLEDKFNSVRQVLEYDYAEKVAPLLTRRLTNRDIPISGDERAVLQELDMLLNYFEHVLYLEAEGHVSTKDRDAIFDYWFEIMKAPERASLRRYAACFNFERVAEALGAGAHDYVAVYGSLMEGLELPSSPDLDQYLVNDGPCEIPGVLYDLGDYPALVPGDGTVHGQLYRLKDPVPGPRAAEALRLIDAYERYDPHDLDGSLYQRRVMRLKSPDHDAWTYIYNNDVSGRPRIESGDWRAYRRGRTSHPVT